MEKRAQILLDEICGCSVVFYPFLVYLKPYGHIGHMQNDKGMRMGYLLQFQNQDLSHLRPGPARAPKAAKRGWVIAQIAFIGS